MNKRVAVNFSELAFREDRGPFLVRLADGPGNELHILIAGAGVDQKGSQDLDDIENVDLRKILASSALVEPDYSDLYEIVFDSYIIYQVRNESYCSCDESEIRHGKYLIIFQESKLLEQLSSVTDVCRLDDGSYFPGTWVHYGIYTQNHVIDVVSHCSPVVYQILEEK